MSDNIKAPAHYQIAENVEVIDVREWWIGKAENLMTEFNGGQVSHIDRAIEYLLRAPGKNGAEDVAKAYQYLHRALHGDWPEEDGS